MRLLNALTPIPTTRVMPPSVATTRSAALRDTMLNVWNYASLSPSADASLVTPLDLAELDMT